MNRSRTLAKAILPEPVVRIIKRYLSKRRCLEVLRAWGHWDRVGGQDVIYAGSTTPWFTYPALAFLSQFDFSTKKVFEWGAGASSIFWSKKAKHVVAVEHDSVWVHRLLPSLQSANVRLIHETEAIGYSHAIETGEGVFDVISIDGVFRTDCAKLAPRHLASDGIIIFDNSDLYPEACRSLRDSGLVQIDFSGFGPILDAAWTTSIFLHGQFGFAASENIQPKSVPGALAAQLDADPLLGSASRE
jgi:hypothetical protein